MHTLEVTPSRLRRPTPRWATVIAITAALAIGPAVLTAAPAFAAEVTSPTDGQTGVESLPFFEGTGVAGNLITITYPGVDGLATAGQEPVRDDGTFAIITEFSALAPEQTAVTATVTETDSDGALVGAPVVRSFTFATAPVEASPFAVLSPEQGEVVTTTTPTFTGTGRPGDTVRIEYSNAVGGTSVAGTGVIGADGTFSIPTSFVDLTPGVVEVRTISTPTGPGGEPSDSANISTNFLFEVAPVPTFVPNPPAIDVVPETITVSDSKNVDRGLQITATGFGQGEDLGIAFTTPDGTTTEFVSDTGFFSDDTGSYADSLVLFGDVVAGDYTITITGGTSGVVLSDTFTVIADPLPAGSGNGGELAATGPGDTFTQGLLALAVLMTLAGTALVVRRRSTAVAAS